MPYFPSLGKNIVPHRHGQKLNFFGLLAHLDQKKLPSKPAFLLY